MTDNKIIKISENENKEKDFFNSIEKSDVGNFSIFYMSIEDYGIEPYPGRISPPDPRSKYIEQEKIEVWLHQNQYFEKQITNAASIDDPRFTKNDVKVIASSNISLIAASKKAEELGFQSYILSDAIEGRASDVGIMHAALAKYRKDKNTTFQRPAVILSGGETTVEILDKPGRGGRNTEFLLAFALSIEKEPNITALAAGN